MYDFFFSSDKVEECKSMKQINYVEFYNIL